VAFSSFIDSLAPVHEMDRPGVLNRQERRQAATVRRRDDRCTMTPATAGVNRCASKDRVKSGQLNEQFIYPVCAGAPIINHQINRLRKVMNPLPANAMNTNLEKPSSQDVALEFLAAEAHIPISEVASLYADELAKLVVSAHVRVFLPIFAVRNVREILAQRSDV
jgi:hypothetical protein